MQRIGTSCAAHLRIKGLWLSFTFLLQILLSLICHVLTLMMTNDATLDALCASNGAMLDYVRAKVMMTYPSGLCLHDDAQCNKGAFDMMRD